MGRYGSKEVWHKGFCAILEMLIKFQAAPIYGAQSCYTWAHNNKMATRSVSISFRKKEIWCVLRSLSFFFFSKFSLFLLIKPGLFFDSGSVKFYDDYNGSVNLPLSIIITVTGENIHPDHG